MSGRVSIPISADLQAADVQAAIQKLVEQLNRAGQAVAAANKVKFEPVTKATVEDLKRVEVSFESLRKVSGELNRRMKATGQQGAGFFDIDWTKLHPDAGARARQQRRAFEYVTGLGFGSLPPAAPPTPGSARPVPPAAAPRPSLPPRQPPAPPGVGALAAGVLRQGLGGGLRAMGPVGGALNGGLSAGMSGGMGVGLAAFAGTLLAQGIGKVIGGTLQKVGQAGDEAIGYDTLKRQLGDVGVGFNSLRATFRTASNQISVTFEESQKLAGEFAGLSGLSRNALALAREVSVAGGFGRSFGIAPELAVSAFGQMRGVGLTRSTDDSRRFALLIGEAVARSGVFSKADEILQAVTGYGMSQTRYSLTGANLPGYAGMLAGMTSSGIPGMDVNGASNILARMNAAIQNGGAAGDPGKMFLYSALGKSQGLDPIQTRLLEEGGTFGTGEQAFGDNSIYRRFAAKYGLGRPGAAGSHETNLQLIRKTLEGQFSNPELMADAFANLTGLNISQSMAMLTMKPEQMGGLQKALQSAHVDLSKISPTAFSALANIETGSPARLMKQVGSLRARTGAQALTGAEGTELDTAVAGGDTEKLRDVLLRLSASRDQEQTEGDKTRQKIQDVDKSLQTAATALLSPLNVMRDALIHLSGGTTRSLRESYLAGERQDAKDQADDKAKAAQQDYEKKRQAQIAKDRAANPGPKGPVLAPPPWLNTPAQQQLRKDYEAQVAKINADRDKQLADLNKANGGIDFGSSSGSGDNSIDDPGSDDDDAASPSSAAGRRGASLGPAERGAYASMKAGLAALDRKYFPNNPGTAGRLVDVESGFNGNARSGKGALGYFQFMPDTLQDAEREAGRYFDPADPQQSMQAADVAMGQKRRWLRAHLGREPTREELLQAWNGGQGRVADHALHGVPLPLETQRYVPSIDADQIGGQMPLPPGSSAVPGSRDSQHHVTFDGKFQLQWPNGTPAAAPITTQSRVGIPVPSGAG